MRRLAAGILVLASLALTACSNDDHAQVGPASSPTSPTATQPVPPTQPSPTQTPTARPVTPLPTAICTPGRFTLAQTEGPYFKAGAPLRTSLIEPGVNGTRLIVTGYVMSRDCRPVADARMEFWHTDAQGNYDNTGYRLRGHLFTDATGLYRLETIVPGLYPGRTRHIHVKVLPPTGPGLTTQTYFPNESGNANDGIFNAGLMMSVQETGDGRVARFDFVVNAS